jgi:hypothetical protein
MLKESIVFIIQITRYVSIFYIINLIIDFIIDLLNFSSKIQDFLLACKIILNIFMMVKFTSIFVILCIDIYNLFKKIDIILFCLLTK